MELASMLAHEPFSERPQSVCPVIGAFLRAYNDRLDDRWRQRRCVRPAGAGLGDRKLDYGLVRGAPRFVDELIAVGGLDEPEPSSCPRWGKKLVPTDAIARERSPIHEEDDVPDSVYPIATRELAARRKEAAPEIHDAFQAFSRQVFADGALPEKTKQLIAVAVAHVTQCPYCIRGHARLAQRRGASEQEIMEAIWVAAEMRAGGAYAHSVLALDALAAEGGKQ
jgi:AhpD family alkylhydroperoxidase